MFLYQPSSGYCYNSDSIFLYDFISRFEPRGKMLDVGCGVGIISLLLSRDFELEMSIIDKQESMLSYAKHNYELSGTRVKAYLGDFVQMHSEDRYDYIISNPPFYASSSTQSEDTHLNTARYAHHLPIADMISKVKSLLAPRGWFVFCYDARHIDHLLECLRKESINPEQIRFVHSKLDRESKLVMIAARNNSKAQTKVLPPLIVFDDESRYLKEAKSAFDKADTFSIKGEIKERI